MKRFFNRTFPPFPPPCQRKNRIAHEKNWGEEAEPEAHEASEDGSSHLEPDTTIKHVTTRKITLQETNISHLGKRHIIFKSALAKGYISSLKGNGGNGTCKITSNFHSFQPRRAVSWLGGGFVVPFPFVFLGLPTLDWKTESESYPMTNW